MKKWGKVFAKSGLLFVGAYTWELLEELLEELIAFGIASFIVKTMSMVLVVALTIGAKKLIFRIVKSIVKKITYKKGDDKMSKVKQFFAYIGKGFKWIFANKKSLTGIASGAVMTLSGTGVIDISALPELPVNGFNITPVIYYGALLVLAIIGVSGKGFESIKTFFTRKEQEKVEKKHKDNVKLAMAEIKAEKKLANQTQAEQEKAKAKAEAEAKEKAEKEQAEKLHRQEIDKIKAEIKLAEAKAKQAELNK